MEVPRDNHEDSTVRMGQPIMIMLPNHDNHGQQAREPRDLVEYLRRHDNPGNTFHETMCIFHPTNSMINSEVKIIASFDSIMSPRLSPETGQDGWTIYRADASKRANQMPVEQWVAARFLCKEGARSIHEENRLPVQVIHFSFPLEKSGYYTAAVMVQHLLLAGQEKAFLKYRLPTFIHGLWRIQESDSGNVLNEALSNNVQQKTAEFGRIKVSWALQDEDKDGSPSPIYFHGEGLTEPFGLTLDASDEEYKALYRGRIESFAGEMGTALQIFLSAEDHVKRRQWDTDEERRMRVLQERFKIKTRSSYVKAGQAWEATKAAEEPAHDDAAVSAEASVPQKPETELGRPSMVGKNAKKNRKEKERRARRDAEIKAKAANPQELRTSASQTPQISVASTSSATVISGTTRHSRSLMIPAVPHQLHFPIPKKGSVTMQSDDPKTQFLSADDKSRTLDSQIPGLGAVRSPSSPQITSEDAREREIPQSSTNMEPLTPVASPQQLSQTTPASPIAGISEGAEGTSQPGSLSAHTARSEDTTSPHQDTITSHMHPTIAAQEEARNQAEIEVATSAAPEKLNASDIDPPVPASAPVRAETEALNIIPPQGIGFDHTQTTVSTSAVDPAKTQTTANDALEDTALTPAHNPISASESVQAQAPTQERLIQFDTFEWPCFSQGCRKITSPFDGSTVICPRCGPYSKVRYCSKNCLFDDVLTHWGLDCGRFTLTQKADPLTIAPHQVNTQPFIPSLTHIDRPERHRQLVRHSLDNTGDYFIFSDFVQWRADGCPGKWPATKHASGSLVATISFTETGSTVPARHVFNRLLHICLLIGGQRTDMTYFLFRMILGRLVELGLDTQDNKQSLVWQFRFEFGFEGTFAGMLTDDSVVAWPLVAGQILQLERQYGTFLSGRAGLGAEWTNAV